MKKIIAVILCLIVMLSVFSCSKPTVDDNGGNDENTTKPSADTSSNTGVQSPYEDIIKKYTALLDKVMDGDALAEPIGSASEIETALYEIVRDVEDPSTMGYATRDINGDGAEELVLLNKSNKLYALFTLDNGEPVLLLKLDDMSAAIMPDGTVYANQYVSGEKSCTQIKKITDGKLEGFEYGSVIKDNTATHYKCENGVKTDITSEEKSRLDEIFVIRNTSYFNKTSGFRFVSAVSESSESTAPVPDFTSYDGIIAAYKTIVESFSEYNQSDWINGKFDSLFRITDNESYEIFHEIFWGGICEMPEEPYFSQTYAPGGDNAYGYAKKDLNGDGVEELILMNENYEMFALFTEQDGKAHLVKGIIGAWIDENGRVHKEIYTGGLVGRDAEAYVYALDGTTLSAEIAVGYRVNLYLKKEGWYKIENGVKVDISAEEGEALYAAYYIMPQDYSDNEYTRNFSGIEFTPLFGKTQAGENHINTFSNIYFVGGYTLTVSEVTASSVTAVIKFVYTEGEFDPETNPEPVTHITELSVQATREGSRYGFEKDGIKGYIEFGVNSAWVIVTESQNEYVFCRAYLFDYPADR